MNPPGSSRVRCDGEAGVVDRDGPQHHARRLGDRLRRPVGAHLRGHREGQLAQALAGGRRDLEHRPAEPLGHLGAHELGELPRVRHVDLVQRDEPRPVGQHTAERRGVAGELVLERLHVRDRVAAGLERRAVDHVHQHRAPLDVPEEVQPQATALGGARDQPRHVGDGEDLLPRGDHAQLRDERGERVVGDLRPGRRQRRDQRRLARRREPDQPDVGDRAQLQHELAGLARLAEQREAGRLARGRGERGVAQPPAAALGGDEPGARPDEVGEDLAVRRHDDGAVGHGELQVVRVRAGLEPALALLAVAGRGVRAVVEVEQGVHARVDDEHDRAAAAAVAAVRAAERLELLAVHRGAAVAARARGGVHHHAVDELGHANFSTKCERRAHPGGAARRSDACGTRLRCAECLRAGLRPGRDHVDDLAALRVPELDRALDEGEQRVVAAATDTLPRGGTWCRAGGRGSRPRSRPGRRTA